MDYKKLYRDALERAKKVNKGEDVDVESGTSLCEYIFPELKESDDERIRKELIEFLRKEHELERKSGTKHPFFLDAISWVEKQDKNKQIMKGKSALEAIHEEKVDNANKQGEQKPFDYENATITQNDFAPKGMTDSQYLDKAVCFIAAREKCDDYICSELHDIKTEREICTKDCQGGLDRICVLRFLKYYKEGGEE